MLREITMNLEALKFQGLENVTSLLEGKGEMGLILSKVYSKLENKPARLYVSKMKPSKK